MNLLSSSSRSAVARKLQLVIAVRYAYIKPRPADRTTPPHGFGVLRPCPENGQVG